MKKYRQCLTRKIDDKVENERFFTKFEEYFSKTTKYKDIFYSIVVCFLVESWMRPPGGKHGKRVRGVQKDESKE